VTKLRHLLKKNSAPSLGELQNAMIDRHYQAPGITERNYGQCKSVNGKSCYEILMEAVDDFEDKTIVDLACGSGRLTEIIEDKFSKFKKIIGIDLCEEELGLARSRLSHPRIEFRCESAQNLSLSSSSVDIILCHLALMLFKPIEPAIDEVARILKPDGVLGAVISGMGEEPLLFSRAVSILRGLVVKDFPKFKTIGWGDSRTWSLEGLQSLFPESLGFKHPIEIENFNLAISGTPEELAQRLPHFFYAHYAFSEERKDQLHQKWLDLFKKENGANGPVNFLLPLTRIKVEKADINASN